MSWLWVLLLRAVVWIDDHMTGFSIKLVRWTGKSKQPIHPKHLVDNPHHYWYIEHIEPGDRVLDVGCGIGAAVLKLASRASFATGFDCDLRNLLTARSKVNQGMTNITYFAASAEAPLPFADTGFDKVLILDVIEHLSNRVGTLREIGRVLRPRGLMLLSAPNRDNRWKRTLRAAGLPSYADADHKIEYTLPELERELTSAGFELAFPAQPTVLETPLAGLIDVMGGLNLRIYERLRSWKVNVAKRYPEEATGWRVVCRKRGAWMKINA